MVRKKINVIVHLLNLKFLGANQLEISSKQWKYKSGVWERDTCGSHSYEDYAPRDYIQLDNRKSRVTAVFKEWP